MEDLLRFKFNQKYVIFDTETEGLNLVTSKPWQLAWIEAEGKKITKKQNRFLMWDDLNVSEDAAKITGFDKKDYLSKAEHPAVVFKEFMDSSIALASRSKGIRVYGFDKPRRCYCCRSEHSWI